jgi:hypothetical protein
MRRASKPLLRGNYGSSKDSSLRNVCDPQASRESSEFVDRTFMALAYRLVPGMEILSTLVDGDEILFLDNC